MIDVDALRSWIGRTQTVSEQISAFPSRALAATLDRDDPPYVDGTALPPLWQWLHFLTVSPLLEAGPDGHHKRGGFLPPVPLPRRMWAGGRLTFHAPLRTGRRATRESTIENIEDKTGRSGRLVFVTVQHRIECDGALCVDPVAGEQQFERAGAGVHDDGQRGRATLPRGVRAHVHGDAVVVARDRKHPAVPLERGPVLVAVTHGAGVGLGVWTVSRGRPWRRRSSLRPWP